MIKIRNYLPSDKEILNKVTIDAFNQYKMFYCDWDRFQSGIGRMADLNEYGKIIIAEYENNIIGGVVYIGPGNNKSKQDYFDRDWAIMRMLVVSPMARGLGAGRILSKECIRCAIKDKVTTFGLHTSPIMETALSMYLRMGFKFYANLPKIYGVNYNIYTMQLDLNNDAQPVNAPEPSAR